MTNPHESSPRTGLDHSLAKPTQTELREAFREQWEKDSVSARGLVEAMRQTNPEDLPAVHETLHRLFSDAFFGSGFTLKTEVDWEEARSKLIGFFQDCLPEEIHPDLYVRPKSGQLFLYKRKHAYVLTPNQVSIIIKRYGLITGQGTTAKAISDSSLSQKMLNFTIQKARFVLQALPSFRQLLTDGMPPLFRPPIQAI